MATENPQNRERRVAVRAGLFVTIGLSLAAIVIFLLGKERMLFDDQIKYVGAFENVDGLGTDAPVRLGGLQVGRVSDINFAPSLGDKRILVTLEVSAKYRERVRRDSVARIASRGVLGDKAVDISLGSPEADVLKPGGEIATGSSGDISSLLKASGEIVDNAVAITRDLRVAIASYTDPTLRENVGGLISSVRNIAGQIENGKGLLHWALYDKQSATDFHQLMEKTGQAAAHLEGAISQAEAILTDVRQGRGTAHALIYDTKLADALSQVGKAADEVASLVLDAKKSPKGALNQLVYGDSKGLLSDLTQVAADLKVVSGRVKSGEGTLGMVINDPTLYEDLKEILGNVKRNRVLRELVRYSISNNENLDQVGKPEGGAPQKKQK